MSSSSSSSPPPPPTEKKSKPLRMTEEEMDRLNVPLYLRDRCVHRVVPLNKCRHENMYIPWKCEEERLRYERCQYKQYLKFVRKSQRLWKKEQKLRLIQEKIAEAKAKDPNYNSSISSSSSSVTDDHEEYDEE
jgi:NADH dehydrogenase (ubiquinone) 1 beta subcomplex subunit 7